MLVKLILFVLPFLHLVSALTNFTAVFGDSPRITATGEWSETNTDCGYYTSTLKSTVSLKFNGVSIHVLGGLSLYGGTVRVTLDDQPARLIDLYGTASCGQVIFSSTGLTDGQHSIELELAGESPNFVTSNDGPARLFVLKSFIWSTPNSSSTVISKSWASILWKRQSTLLPPAPPTPPPTPPSPPTPPPTTPPPSPPTPPPTTPPSQPTPPSPATPPTTPASPPSPPTVPTSPSAATSPPSAATSPPSAATSPPSAATPPPSVSTSSSSSSSSSLTLSLPSSLTSSRSSLPPSSSSRSLSSTSSRSLSSTSSRSLSSTSSLSPSDSSSQSSSLPRPPPRSTSTKSESSFQLNPSLTTPSPDSPSSSSKSSKYVNPPTSTLPSESVPTVTATASGPAQDVSGVRELWTCKPYGSNDCVFNPQEAAGENTYSLIVGAPASNCGGKTDSVVVVGGQVTISDTWSQDVTPGLSLGRSSSDLVLNTSESQLWGNTQSQHLSRVVKMTIPPERQGALVAQVTYNSTNGTLQIGNETPFYVRANQPRNEVEFMANLVPCDAEFNGNYTPQYETSSSSGATQGMKPHDRAIVVVVAAFAVLIFL